MWASSTRSRDTEYFKQPEGDSQRFRDARWTCFGTNDLIRRCHALTLASLNHYPICHIDLELQATLILLLIVLFLQRFDGLATQLIRLREKVFEAHLVSQHESSQQEISLEAIFLSDLARSTHSIMRTIEPKCTLRKDRHPFSVMLSVVGFYCVLVAYAGWCGESNYCSFRQAHQTPTTRNSVQVSCDKYGIF